MKKNRNLITWIGIGLITISFVLLLLPTQLYQLKSKSIVSTEILENLTKLGNEALKSNDVPVAALLIYKDSIIGKGYNTVLDKKELSAHAEINAINMAFKKYGQEFHKLDRSKLYLYSSFEPCEMCKGAIIHYNINHVYFEQGKSIFHQFKSTLKELKYEFFKKKMDAEDLQENLFLKHPDYYKNTKNPPLEE